MKTELKLLIQKALSQLQANQVLPDEIQVDIQIERSREPKHGDFASNIALMLAKPAKKNPRELAQAIVEHIETSGLVSEVSIAGPGFINFRLHDKAYFSQIKTAIEQGQQFGQSDIGGKNKVYLEYVSANPTGPLHVGHGRGAAYGASVANLLNFAGFKVHREYYVNDAGRQMNILALSTYLRYLELCGIAISLPANAYQGDYIIDIAKSLHQQFADKFKHDLSELLQLLPETVNAEDDKELYLDALIVACKQLIGDSAFEHIHQLSLNAILEDIKQDLSEFSVEFEQWFRESQLFKDGLVEQGIDLLKQHGYVYEKQGATWFKATELGDEKDRVLIRANGLTTYFASDVAYHLHKYNTGASCIIDIFGADHHGYSGRINAFLKGLGEDPGKLKILLVQFAILYRGAEKVSMSTRSGQFVTLRELRAEVGNDAARFFYISRRPEQHLDFDLELAKKQSNENPVYYIQYAHARIASVWRQIKKANDSWDLDAGLNNLNLLQSSYEIKLAQTLSRFAEVVEKAAIQYEPHLVAHYLQELANAYHTYYNAEKFLVDESALKNARLCLNLATQIVIKNGLNLLGVSAPVEM